jgi:hypothetical protein
MAAPDISGGGQGQPAEFGFQIVPSDTQDLAVCTRAIYIGGAGNLTVVLRGQQANLGPQEGIGIPSGVQSGPEAPVTFTGVVAGTILAIRVGKVKATGTTASGLVGLY